MSDLAESEVSKAITYLGGPTVLARYFKVTPWAVSKWRKQLPAERCPDIEKLSEGKFRCEQLRPDVDWGVLRGNSISSNDDSLLDKAS
ncbi:transcriptional regulator [Neptunicella sp.]|uniref:transcriptional regulator n=1 Tax=Neptunicella sp. TaxID=2125986 RepID=UPI003F6911DE